MQVLGMILNPKSDNNTKLGILEIPLKIYLNLPCKADHLVKIHPTSYEEKYDAQFNYHTTANSSRHIQLGITFFSVVDAHVIEHT